MNEVNKMVDTTSGPSLAFQLGKMLFVAVVTFGVSKVAERGFDAGVSAIKNHQFSVPSTEG